MADYRAQLAAWRRNGPPLIIGMVHIATSLGVKLIPENAEGSADELAPVAIDPNKPSLADLAATIQPLGAGADTTAASRAILQRLKDGQ